MQRPQVKLMGRILLIICLPGIALISVSTIPSPGPILDLFRKSDSGNRQMYNHSTKERNGVKIPNLKKEY